MRSVCLDLCCIAASSSLGLGFTFSSHVTCLNVGTALVLSLSSFFLWKNLSFALIELRLAFKWGWWGDGQMGRFTGIQLPAQILTPICRATARNYLPFLGFNFSVDKMVTNSPCVIFCPKLLRPHWPLLVLGIGAGISGSETQDPKNQGPKSREKPPRWRSTAILFCAA